MSDTHDLGEPLYSARRHIHPAAVSGRFRRLKWALLCVFLGIYWLTPWIRWDRGPYAPDQAVLIDLAHRRFFFFFIEIWPDEFFYVAGLLIMAGLGLFLVTALMGRAWCGYACPQTVWTDLFFAVERKVIGDRNAQVKLDAAPWTAGKARRKLTVWTAWLLIAVCTGGAWVFYFADAPTLMVDLFTLQAAPVAYATIATLTATTFVLAGFMREQVCTYMCPWPRIQGAMLDDQSLIVTYHDWRGEPRSRHAKKAALAGLDVGDCVDCNACVAVCPVGIDIRDGQQLECITCALCIDACDRVMDKLDRPRGLIAYSTLRDYEKHDAIATQQGRAAACAVPLATPMASLARPRTLLYTGMLAAIGLGMLVALVTRPTLSVHVLQDRAPLFTRLSDGSIRNGYTLKIGNRTPWPRTIYLSIEGLEGGTAWLPDSPGTAGEPMRIDLPPDAVRDLRLFASRPEQNASQADFSLTLTDQTTGEVVDASARFEAGEKR